MPCRAILAYGQTRSVLRTSSSAITLATPGRSISTSAVTMKRPSSGSRPNVTDTATEAPGMGMGALVASRLNAPWKQAA